MKNILSVDVEDWFHILELNSTPDIDEWPRLESRVEKNFHTMLNLFDNMDVKVTCFFLGWIAERFPDLVKQADQLGHEIASHGYSHQLIHIQAREDFAEDVTKAKKLIEDIIGKAVLGYRAPGFSVTNSTKWALDELSKAGYQYDSSIFPTSHGHGGIIDAKIYPHKIQVENGVILEFPITVVSFMGKKLCFFGGGYLRLFPYILVRHFSDVVNKEGRPVIYFVHPREIDPKHPRLRMGLKRRFKSYFNLQTTMTKIKKLVREQDLVTFRDWIDQAGNSIGNF